MKDKIIKLIKENYNTSEDLEARVEQLLECVEDNNVFNNLEQVMVWFNNKLKEFNGNVVKVNLNDCDVEWFVEKNTGNIKHISGGYFDIVGVKTDSNVRESGNGWIQPIIDQGTEASVVGLIKKRFDNIPHYLIDAKFEPGNYGKIQFSPTLQCTYDNLNKVHKGRKPLYSEYFEEDSDNKVLFEHWYPEDGGRFYLKRVKTMIVEVNSDVEVSESHIWLTMFQMKELLKKDNLVNAHLRSLISYL